MYPDYYNMYNPYYGGYEPNYRSSELPQFNSGEIITLNQAIALIKQSVGDEKEDELVQQISDREYIIEGSMSLDDVNDHLNTKLESEDYDSLGGFIIEHLDRLPATGDEVMTEDGIRLVVEKLDKNRVESVHIYLPESDVTASDTHTETAAVSSDDSSEQKVSSEHEV